MKKIAIVSNNKYENKIIEDIRINDYLNSHGVYSEIISWENQNLDFSKYDALVLKSVWGYQHDYSNFKKWLNKLEKNNVIMFNDYETIKNNIRKDIQFNLLDKYNIPHIKTIFQKDKIDLKGINPNYVVKPIVSGSGDNTYKVKEANIKQLEKIILEDDNGIMIQPYENEIEKGEYSIIFIDGINTHNIIRFPGIFYEKKKPIQIHNVPSKVLELANKVQKIPEFSNLLYMRIDIIDSNNPKIMEVELAEPDLLTRNIDSENPIKILCNGIIKRLK